MNEPLPWTKRRNAKRLSVALVSYFPARPFYVAPGLSGALNVSMFHPSLPIWYVQLATNRSGGSSKEELLRHFLAVARQAGITHISEERSLDDWAKAMGPN